MTTSKLILASFSDAELQVESLIVNTIMYMLVDTTSSSVYLDFCNDCFDWLANIDDAESSWKLNTPLEDIVDF